jgi:NAD(P)H-quinone oxidoreductase subunit 5
MHAGIVNAGGFLVVRFSPIITFSPASLNTLALVGAFTALFASIVMLTQTSIKRSLAYSTVAQMGFMMLQCGLGAFALAILHLVAHSLYKAYAFLSSGSIVSISKSAWSPSGRPTSQPFVLLGTLIASVGLTLAIGSLFGNHASGDAGLLLLGSIFIMALAYLLWNLWSSSHRSSLILWGLVIISATAAAYFSLHTLFDLLLAEVAAVHQPDRSPAEYVVMSLVGLAFMAVLVMQSQLPNWSGSRLGRKLYVHASHGFYLSTIFNRLTLAVFGKSHS